MTILTDTQRLESFADFMEYVSEIRDLGVITKADLRAALNATDDWIEANAASFNSALPQPARGALTNQQKTLLFFHVAGKRYKVL